MITNIPLELKDNYPLRSASGNAWFDATADSSINYTYKVQIINRKDEVLTENESKVTAYPAKPFATEIIPLSLKSVNGTMLGEFELVNAGLMKSCKVFRSYYLRSGFEEIQGEPLFVDRDGKKIIQITDRTAVPKVPYTYAVIPVDAAGNFGNPSADLKAFNVVDNTIVPSVINFNTTSLETEKAIKLTWDIKDSKDIISIDIYKSKTYDTGYTKVASLAAKETSFLDTDVKPVETYYYAVTLHGAYEVSPSSPRVPGILKASNKNDFSPQNLSLVQDKNLVHLKWQRVEEDTRAYYVYRGNGANGKMEQISKLIITDSTNISYTDTLSQAAQAGIYYYAVADQNTSYAISQLSDKVIAYHKGINALPIPYNVVVRQANDGILQVIWPNMRAESGYINGYKLYRRAKSIDGKQEEALKQIGDNVISSTVNSYTDSTAKDGMVYYYSVKTVDDDQTTLSSPSLEAGITIQPIKINGVANVQIFSNDKAITVKWNNPIADDIKAIKVIRSAEGKEDEEIASLPPTISAFSDTKIIKGNTYYYQLQVENKQGKKSKMTDAVGVKIY
ncbi:MAG: hypothetical protein EOO93_12900 [Pedobacter sp.]|nr:MAG: hypothetical protein EOO93_12900 [Pedobacter sp.]